MRGRRGARLRDEAREFRLPFVRAEEAREAQEAQHLRRLPGLRERRYAVGERLQRLGRPFHAVSPHCVFVEE
jgi:hypothetical protein